jgi:hypothetical protein
MYKRSELLVRKKVLFLELLLQIFCFDIYYDFFWGGYGPSKLEFRHFVQMRYQIYLHRARKFGNTSVRSHF